MVGMLRCRCAVRAHSRLAGADNGLTRASSTEEEAEDARLGEWMDRLHAPHRHQC